MGVVSSVSIFSHSLAIMLALLYLNIINRNRLSIKAHQYIKLTQWRYMIRWSMHKAKELRLRQGLLHVLIYMFMKFFYRIRVSRQFRVSLKSLNTDMYLTHSCWTEFLCLLPHVMNIHFSILLLFWLFSIVFY